MSIKNNIISLQDLLDQANALPEAENLDTEISTQTELISEQDVKIAELARVLAGKASGDSSVSYDTCTVSVATIEGQLYSYCATCFDGENIVYKYNFSDSNLGDTTITGVICGSPISITCKVTNGILDYDENLTLVGKQNSIGAIFIAPSQAEAMATIRLGSYPNISGGGDN